MPRVRRRRTVHHLDPNALEEPGWLDQLCDLTHQDVYFADEPDPTSLAYIVDSLLDRLPEPERVSIELTVIKQFSYREASAYLDADPDIDWTHDPKAIWRYRRRGLDLIERLLTGTPWVRVLVGDRIPQPEPEEEA